MLWLLSLSFGLRRASEPTITKLSLLEVTSERGLSLFLDWHYCANCMHSRAARAAARDAAPHKITPSLQMPQALVLLCSGDLETGEEVKLAL